MSYRIEEKLSIDSNSILEFKNYLNSKTAKQIYQPRKIESLYFENNKREMYNDSLEGLTPRKKFVLGIILTLKTLNYILKPKFQVLKDVLKLGL